MALLGSSKSASTQANASDGGILTMGGIAPLTINRQTGGTDWKTLLLIVSGLAAGLVGLWLLSRLLLKGK